MGHGPVTIVKYCKIDWIMNSLTHSSNSPMNQYETILRTAVQLYDQSCIHPEDIRGIGLSMKNLINQVFLNIDVYR